MRRGKHRCAAGGFLRKETRVETQEQSAGRLGQSLSAPTGCCVARTELPAACLLSATPKRWRNTCPKNMSAETKIRNWIQRGSPKLERRANDLTKCEFETKDVLTWFISHWFATPNLCWKSLCVKTHTKRTRAFHTKHVPHSTLLAISTKLHVFCVDSFLGEKARVSGQQCLFPDE